MEENWCALCLAILKNCTPEQAFEWLNRGLKKRPAIRGKEINNEIVRLRKLGLTNAQVAKLLGLTKQTVSKRFNRMVKAG